MRNFNFPRLVIRGIRSGIAAVMENECASHVELMIFEEVLPRQIQRLLSILHQWDDHKFDVGTSDWGCLKQSRVESFVRRTVAMGFRRCQNLPHVCLLQHVRECCLFCLRLLSKVCVLLGFRSQ